MSYITKKELVLLKKCNGKHSTMNELFDCKSCNVLLKAPKKIKNRLEYLRGELRGERISYRELAELESLKEYIDKGDVELLQAAGVPEFT